MAFLRNLLATLLGLTIFFGFITLIIIGIASVSADTAPSVGDKSVLYLKLSGVVLEQARRDPIEEMLGTGPRPVSLVDLLYVLDEAKNDDRIKGIYLESEFFVAGQASMLEIRNAIEEFKTSGKFVYAYGEYISEGEYLVSSAADTLFIHPEGMLEFNGMSANLTFFKGLFDKLEIEPQIFRVGEYKSAVEPFIRKSMSNENKLQLTELVSSVYGTYLSNVSASRDIPVNTLEEISDQMKVRTPEDAQTLGLVARVGYEDEVKGSIRQKLGLDEEEEIDFISYENYLKAAKHERTEFSRNKIAVIVADGDIIMGEEDEAVGGEQFAKEIRKARESSSIKAIVLRVNSPGGSLTASDMIWREVKLTQGVKPIIASMSNVAASGGYYISVACDTIVAQPNTITGSIGIFGMIFNFGGFLENKLGITTDNVKTGEFSNLYTVTRSLEEDERQIIQNMVERGYETFIDKVVEGRGLSREQVEKVAGGRVWSGEQALQLQLVDVLGSFEDAVELAAMKAGIEDDFRLSYYPRQKPFLEELLSRIDDEADARIFGGEDHIFSSYLRQLKSLEKMNGLQVRLPGNLQVQ